MLQALLASEPVVTSGYLQVVESVHYGQSDSLGNELGVTGIALPITQNRTESPEGPKRDLTELTEKEATQKVVELGHLWNDVSTNLDQNLLKDGVAPNNVKSQKYHSMHCIAHILT